MPEEVSHTLREAKRYLLFGSVVALLLALVAGNAQAQAGLQKFTGSFNHGAMYSIEVPPNWHGTLFLYSHGYVAPGSANPATDAGDQLTGAFLLANGFALASSSHATTGWSIHEAPPDQIATLDKFEELVRHPGSGLGNFR